MENNKGAFQERLQSMDYGCPKYKTVRCGGADHAPLWKSSIYLNGNLIHASNSVCRTKGEAEQTAAREGLLYWNKYFLEKPTSTTKKELRPVKNATVDSTKNVTGRELCIKNVVVMIDVENMCGVTIDVLNLLDKHRSIPEGLNIWFFMSESCNLSDRISDWLSGFDNPCVKSYVVNISSRDASDMHICMEATRLIERNVSVVIVSNDRFAHSFSLVATEIKNEWGSQTCSIVNLKSKKQVMSWLEDAFLT